MASSEYIMREADHSLANLQPDTTLALPDSARDLKTSSTLDQTTRFEGVWNPKLGKYVFSKEFQENLSLRSFFKEQFDALKEMEDKVYWDHTRYRWVFCRLQANNRYMPTFGNTTLDSWNNISIFL